MNYSENSTKAHKETKEYDIAFIGSGIANSFIILGMLKNLEVLTLNAPIKIALVEKEGQFHTGIPYG